jgi:hypothetical protein
MVVEAGRPAAPVRRLARTLRALALSAPWTLAGEGTPAPPGSAGPLDPAAVEAALARGAACLARTDGGGTFGDPYLEYVYPGEDLPAPPPRAGEPRPTYRIVDADTILVLLGREGGVPEVLRPAVERAGARLGGVVPLWRGRGLTNVRRGPDPNGIALDTYCFVGWLHSDAGMAAAVEAALDGDRWLRDGIFRESERFRALADEAWCLRLLAAAREDLGAARSVLGRLAETFREDRRADPAGRAAFYDAWHLGMVLRAIESASARRGAQAPAAEPDGSLRSLRAEVMDALGAWAEAHGGAAGASRADVVEWANLAAADVLRAPEGRALREMAVRHLAGWQDADGCWSIPGSAPPGKGRGFLTLRALLALAVHRGGGDGAGEGPVSRTSATSGETPPRPAPAP